METGRVAGCLGCKLMSERARWMIRRTQQWCGVGWQIKVVFFYSLNLAKVDEEKAAAIGWWMEEERDSCLHVHKAGRS